MHKHRVPALLMLDGNKSDREHTRSDQGADDIVGVPWLGNAAPVQSKEQTLKGADDEDQARDVHLEETLLERVSMIGEFALSSLGGRECEDDNGRCEGSDREVDVEAISIVSSLV